MSEGLDNHIKNLILDGYVRGTIGKGLWLTTIPLTDNNPQRTMQEIKCIALSIILWGRDIGQWEVKSK